MPSLDLLLCGTATSLQLPYPPPPNPVLQPRPLLGLPPRPPGQLRWVPPPTPQGILQKTSFFFFLCALEQTATSRGHPRASLGPVPLPPTPHGTEALGPPEPLPRSKPRQLHVTRSTLQPSPATQALGLPVHQASSGGYPPPPHRASFKKRHFSKTTKIRHTVPLPPTPPGTETRALAPPSQPFPDPQKNDVKLPSKPTLPGLDPVCPPTLSCNQHLGLPPGGQLRWVPPPPHRASFKTIFLLFVRKNTTHVAKFAPSWGPCPYHLPPSEPKPLEPPPSPCPAKPTLP